MSASSAIFIAVGGVTTAVPALKGRVVDAAMLFGTGPELAEALGAGRIVLDYRIRGTGPKSLQALWGSTLSWNAYGPYIDKNPEVVAAFSAANNDAIAWIKDPQNQDELYRMVEERMPLPDALANAAGTSGTAATSAAAMNEPYRLTPIIRTPQPVAPCSMNMST